MAATADLLGRQRSEQFPKLHRGQFILGVPPSLLGAGLVPKHDCAIPCDGQCWGGHGQAVQHHQRGQLTQNFDG